ncbi:hypothetical protein SMMN14_02232 [Sphaerulina musiva]
MYFGPKTIRCRTPSSRNTGQQRVPEEEEEEEQEQEQEQEHSPTSHVKKENPSSNLPSQPTPSPSSSSPTKSAPKPSPLSPPPPRSTSPSPFSALISNSSAANPVSVLTTLLLQLLQPPCCEFGYNGQWENLREWKFLWARGIRGGRELRRKWSGGS